jgi:hypothetical protein
MHISELLCFLVELAIHSTNGGSQAARLLQDDIARHLQTIDAGQRVDTHIQVSAYQNPMGANTK